MSKQLYPHPECMAPDGADPCEGYHQALNRIADLKRQLQEARSGELLSQITALDDYARAELFSNFCRECGRHDPLSTCQCWNDE